MGFKDFKEKLVSDIKEIENEQGIKIKSVHITKADEYFPVCDSEPQYVDFNIDIEI